MSSGLYVCVYDILVKLKLFSLYLSQTSVYYKLHLFLLVWLCLCLKMKKTDRQNSIYESYTGLNTELLQISRKNLRFKLSKQNVIQCHLFIWKTCTNNWLNEQRHDELINRAPNRLKWLHGCILNTNKRLDLLIPPFPSRPHSFHRLALTHYTDESVLIPA